MQGVQLSNRGARVRCAQACLFQTVGFVMNIIWTCPIRVGLCACTLQALGC